MSSKAPVEECDLCDRILGEDKGQCPGIGTFSCKISQGRQQMKAIRKGGVQLKTGRPAGGEPREELVLVSAKLDPEAFEALAVIESTIEGPREGRRSAAIRWAIQTTAAALLAARAATAAKSKK